MSAWLLAALFCAPVSAQVFETGGAAAPVAPVSGSVGSVMGAGAAISPITAVPGASILAPSLNGAVISAFPGRPATNLPAGAVRFAPAPLPALPAAAAASAAAAPAPGAGRQDSPAPTSAAPSRRDLIPPSAAAGASSPRAVAADRRRASDADASPEGVSARLGAAGRELSAPLNDTAGLDQFSAEGAALLGRKVFDRAGDRASLADGSAAGRPGASAVAGGAPSESRDPLLAAFAGGGVEGETLRDAVASPIPAAVPPAAAFSFFRLPSSLSAPLSGGTARPASGAERASAPITFERLSLELGSGLVVRVRAILGLAPAAAPRGFDGAAKGTPAAASSARRPRVPITSTEWLERRGLLESISASEAAASQEAALPPPLAPARAPAFGLAPVSAPRTAVSRAFVFLDPAAPARVPPFAWWGLALLPAGLVLLKELL